MSDDAPVQAVCEALADPDCREILAALDEPLTAKAVVERCDLPRTSTYRKLEALSDAGLVEERTDLRVDGHHATTYVRDVSGVVLDYDDETWDVTVVDDADSAGDRLARYWSRIREEL
jgi:DNA-binding transcriptional ArsR family regulator